MVLLFWRRLTQVVLEKRPLNECSSTSASIQYSIHADARLYKVALVLTTVWFVSWLGSVHTTNPNAHL